MSRTLEQAPSTFTKLFSRLRQGEDHREGVMVGGGNGTVNCGTGCVNRPSGKDRHQRSLREDCIATDRALGDLFTEELGA